MIDAAPSLPPEWVCDMVCAVCPSQDVPVGGYDVIDGPSAAYPFDRATGRRAHVDTGAPVCVHPYRVCLSPGLYRSAPEGPRPNLAHWQRGDPLTRLAEPRDVAPAAPAVRTMSPMAQKVKPRPIPSTLAAPVLAAGDLPDGLPLDEADLADWLRSVLREAPPERFDTVLCGAETVAGQRFGGDVVVAALRTVLARGF